MTEDDLKRVNTKKLAKILDVTPRTILRWRKLGKLPQPEMQSGRPYWTLRQLKEQDCKKCSAKLK